MNKRKYAKVGGASRRKPGDKVWGRRVLPEARRGASAREMGHLLVENGTAGVREGGRRQGGLAESRVGAGVENGSAGRGVRAGAENGSVRKSVCVWAAQAENSLNSFEAAEKTLPEQKKTGRRGHSRGVGAVREEFGGGKRAVQRQSGRGWEEEKICGEGMSWEEWASGPLEGYDEDLKPDRDRAFSQQTVYLVHKWLAEGMPLPMVARMLNRSVENVRAAAEVPLLRGEKALIQRYFCPFRMRKETE